MRLRDQENGTYKMEGTTLKNYKYSHFSNFKLECSAKRCLFLYARTPSFMTLWN